MLKQGKFRKLYQKSHKQGRVSFLLLLQNEMTKLNLNKLLTI